MRYKILKEPLYAYECLDILQNIVNGKSIINKQERIIRERGHHVDIEQFFHKSLALEKHVADNINFEISGFGENCAEMAEYLFKKEEFLPESLVHAVFYYNHLLGCGIDNKTLAILAVVMEDRAEEEGWDENPPNFTDGEFFSLIDSIQASPAEKYSLINLYHRFDTYRAYTDALVRHAEELYREKMPIFYPEAEIFMEKARNLFKERGGEVFKEMFSVTLDDDCEYLVYPGLYNACSCQFIAVTVSTPSIMLGLHLQDILNAYNAETIDRDKASAFLKCLSDNTKQAIMQKLKSGPLYGSQLAEMLDCTGANISHHMPALLKLGVVHARKENNKLFFHLDGERVNKYFDDAKSLFM